MRPIHVVSFAVGRRPWRRRDYEAEASGATVDPGGRCLEVQAYRALRSRPACTGTINPWSNRIRTTDAESTGGPHNHLWGSAWILHNRRWVNRVSAESPPSQPGSAYPTLDRTGSGRPAPGVNAQVPDKRRGEPTGAELRRKAATPAASRCAHAGPAEDATGAVASSEVRCRPGQLPAKETAPGDSAVVLHPSAPQPQVGSLPPPLAPPPAEPVARSRNRSKPLRPPAAR